MAQALIEVFLAVDSDDLSKERLATILNLSPDEGWDRGSPYVVADKIRLNGFSRWCIVERADTIDIFSNAVDRLIQRVEAIRSYVALLPPNTRVAFSSCISTPDTVFGLGLSVEQVQFLASLGASVDMSFAISTRRRSKQAPSA
jgi:Domain of unknown function (DUF4279)